MSIVTNNAIKRAHRRRVDAYLKRVSNARAENLRKFRKSLQITQQVLNKIKEYLLEQVTNEDLTCDNWEVDYLIPYPEGCEKVNLSRVQTRLRESMGDLSKNLWVVSHVESNKINVFGTLHLA